MGNFSSRQVALQGVEEERIEAYPEHIPAASRKRKRPSQRRKYRSNKSNDSSNSDGSSSDEDEEENEFKNLLQTPKRKRLTTTSKYIYQRLFLEGTDSDITVSALDHEWKLHKLYLAQSPYFASMFSGSWRESSLDFIQITIADPNITVDALVLSLSSLYQDEVDIEPASVISILACATLLQLEGLIDQCVCVMQETINVSTVFKYFEAAVMYGEGRVRNACLRWLKINLLHHLPEQPDRLKDLSVDLMSSLIASADLFVMQTEFSVYVLLRLWLFLLFHKDWRGNPQEAVLMSHKFFQDRVKTTRSFFLETEEGRPYTKVFKELRFSHLVNHHMDMDMLLSDRIVPRSWMYPIYQAQWQTLLRIDQGIDKGPQTLSEADFNALCLRCGRTLNTPGQQHMWRWTGFNMGVDLIVTFDNWNLSLKRSLTSTGTNEHEALLSNHKKRHIFYRVTVVSLNDQKQVTYEESSGIQSVSLGRNGSHPLLKIDQTRATFPLLLSFNFAVSTPLSTSTAGAGEDDVFQLAEEVDVENVQA